MFCDVSGHVLGGGRTEPEHLVTEHAPGHSAGYKPDCRETAYAEKNIALDLAQYILLCLIYVEHQNFYALHVLCGKKKKLKLLTLTHDSCFDTFWREERNMLMARRREEKKKEGKEDLKKKLLL